MAQQPVASNRLAPVHWFSHGTPSMLGEESDSADYWQKCGEDAHRHGVKHIIIMVRAMPLNDAVALA